MRHPKLPGLLVAALSGTGGLVEIRVGDPSGTAHDGGNLLSSSEQSLSYIKNREVLAANQNSMNNRQVRRDENSAVWMADVSGSSDRYLALFHLADDARTVQFTLEHEMLRGQYALRDLWSGTTAGHCEKEIRVKLKNLMGPYTRRRAGVPHGGHSTLFQDGKGQWHLAFFGNDRTAPFRAMPGIVELDIQDTGNDLLIRPRVSQFGMGSR